MNSEWTIGWQGKRKEAQQLSWVPRERPRAEKCGGDSVTDGGQAAGRCLSRQMGHGSLGSFRRGTRIRESGEMSLFWSEKWEGRRELPWSEVCGCARCRGSQGAGSLGLLCSHVNSLDLVASTSFYFSSFLLLI